MHPANCFSFELFDCVFQTFKEIIESLQFVVQIETLHHLGPSVTSRNFVNYFRKPKFIRNALYSYTGLSRRK